MTIPLKHRPDGLGEFEPNDVVPIEHGGTGSSTLLDAQNVLGITDKLDRSEYTQHFKGWYETLAELETAVSVGADGDYAHIGPDGTERKVYIWGGTSGWQLQQTGGGSGGVPNWYDITTLAITSMHPNLDLANTKFEVAKINGLLCIRGFFKVTANISGDLTDMLFVIKDPAWMVDVSYMPLTAPYLLPVGSHSVGFGIGDVSDLTFAQQLGGVDGIYATIANGATISGDLYNFAPYCLGKAVE
jgi:hypothetical protein